MLFDAVRDPMVAAGLNTFAQQMKRENVEQLLRAVRRNDRDTMQEARFAGKVEAYEAMMEDLEQFSEEQLKGAA